MIGRRGFLGALGAVLAASRAKLQAEPATPVETYLGPTKDGVCPIRVEEVSADGLTTRVISPEEWRVTYPRTEGFICSGWVSNVEADRAAKDGHVFYRSADRGMRCKYCHRVGWYPVCEGCGVVQ